MVQPFLNIHHVFRILACSKCILRFYINTAENIHNIDQRGKVQPYIVINVRLVQVTQRCHGSLYAVYPGMSQFIHRALLHIRSV